METVATAEAEQVYRRFAETVGSIGFETDRLSVSDEQFAYDAVGALLVTEPLDEGKPFSVPIDEKVQSNFQRYSGQDFEVCELGVSNFGTGYRVRFTAFTPDRECAYVFVGKLSAQTPHIVVERAIVSSPKYL